MVGIVRSVLNSSIASRSRRFMRLGDLPRAHTPILKIKFVKCFPWGKMVVPTLGKIYVYIYSCIIVFNIYPATTC